MYVQQVISRDERAGKTLAAVVVVVVLSFIITIEVCRSSFSRAAFHHSI